MVNVPKYSNQKIGNHSISQLESLKYYEYVGVERDGNGTPFDKGRRSEYRQKD